MQKTYHGSCRCGAVAFAADIDLDKGTTRCNCSFCRKARNWGVLIKPEAFRLLRGRDRLGRYDMSGGGHSDHCFCAICGIRVFSEGDVPEIGGAFVSVAIAALDDASEAELIAAPLTWCDGLNNNWWNPPGEIRHL
ncbi:MAG: GFA family protein [bacterium]